MKEEGIFKSKTQVSSALPPDKARAKKKRLFQWAINQLLKEGYIVLWDGPVRECSNVSIADTSRLWKSTTSSDDSISGCPNTGNDNDEGYLSDPLHNEAAYISFDARLPGRLH